MDAMQHRWTAAGGGLYTRPMTIFVESAPSGSQELQESRHTPPTYLQASEYSRAIPKVPKHRESPLHQAGALERETGRRTGMLSGLMSRPLPPRLRWASLNGRPPGTRGRPEALGRPAATGAE